MATGIGTYPLGVTTFGFYEPKSTATLQKTTPDYALDVIQSSPEAYWRMDTSSDTTFIDSSGFGRNATTAGGVVVGQYPLITGGFAARFPAGANATATVPHFLTRGRESVSFAFEVWTKFTGTQPVERHLMGRVDAGLYLVPSGFEFRATNTLGEVFRCRYIVPHWKQNYHVVATYGDRTMTIHVNGESGESVNFSGSFSNTSETFYLSSGTTGSEVIMDEAAVYRGAIVGDSIVNHYLRGISKNSYFTQVVKDGGTRYSFDDTDSLPHLDFVDEFSGESSGYRYLETVFIGEYGVIDGSRIDWDSPNNSVSVEVSLDSGTTWTPCVNHQTIPGLASGVDTTGMFLSLRQNFASPDTAAVPAIISGMRAVIYDSKQVVATQGGLVPVVTGEVDLAQDDYNFINNSPEIGAKFRRAGTLNSRIVIPAAPTAYRSIDFWVRRDVASTTYWQYMVDARPGLVDGWFGFNNTGALSVGPAWTTVYINGVAKTPVAEDFPVGKWTHVALIANADWTGDLSVGNAAATADPWEGAIAHFSVYNNALTGTQAASHYVAGLQSHSVTYADESVTIFRDVESRAYTFAWQTYGNG